MAGSLRQTHLHGAYLLTDGPWHKAAVQLDDDTYLQPVNRYMMCQQVKILHRCKPKIKVEIINDLFKIP